MLRGAPALLQGPRPVLVGATIAPRARVGNTRGNGPVGLRYLRDKGAAEIQPAVPRLRVGQGLVLLQAPWPEEMHDLLPAGVQELRDQAPVTTPPKRCGAGVNSTASEMPPA
jgi:hypothetical protein